MSPKSNFRRLILAVSLALASASSHALIAWADPSASIVDTVTPTGASWNYSYTLTNTTPCLLTCESGTFYGEGVSLKEFALPYFSDAGIALIASPAGWSSQILASDRFQLGNGAQTIVWTANSTSTSILVGNSLSGFGYQASYSAGKGPYQITTVLGLTSLGDPAIPLSPLAQTAGIQAMTMVDEPSSLAMLLAGIGLVGGIAQRRRAIAE